MTTESFAPGHVFFRGGDPSDRAYALREGQVELLAGEGDDANRITLFGPGDVFGETALIEERPRLVTARAVNVSQT
jgi:CRP-like cAMP-binding protein